MATGLTAVRPGERSGLAWFGVLAPPLAWATQLVLGYAMQEAGCGRPDADLWGVRLDPLTAVVIGICGGVAMAGGLAALAAWRSAPDPRGRVRFLAAAGMTAGFVFLLGIVLTGIALLPLDACDAG